MAERIWRLICNNKHINIYILKEPREELIFFDRCKYLDVDSGLFVEPVSFLLYFFYIILIFYISL